MKELNTSLSFELHNPLQKDNYDSMEISELMVINKHLKDKNDELIMQLQSITNGPDETFEEDLNFNAESQEDFNQQISLLLTQPQPESLKQECEQYLIILQPVIVSNFSITSFSRDISRIFIEFFFRMFI